MQRLLSKEHDELLQKERNLLEDLRVALARLDAADEDIERLKNSLRQLDELFLIVVVGEFNAGKTAFLNAMLGEQLLTEGVTPTTSDIHLLRYGDTVHQELTEQNLLLVTAPVEWLRDINLVDTPGTNAVIQQHQEITEEFVPRSDLVLFVTSSDRPFSESERSFLARIREWGKKIVIVVNKIDLVQSRADREKILDFVRENAIELLGVEPEIFPVSARLALQAKEAANSLGRTQPTGDVWEASQFEPLEGYILDTLDSTTRLRLKLENPLGVGERLAEQYVQTIDERSQLLTEDVETLDFVDSQLDAYDRDMRRDFTYHASHVDNVLYEMAERAERYFDNTLRIGRIFDLVNSEKLRGEFERDVIADTSRQIEHQVNDLIDWMIEKDHRQWQDVMEYLNRRTTEHADRMVGQVNNKFVFNRQKLIDSVGREAQKVVDTYDREAESLKLAQEVQRAIVQTAAVEAGAIGLGAVLVAVLQTTMLDISGVLGATAIAALGLYVLPYRRSKIKTDLRERLNELREQLHTAMNRQFEHELRESMQRIREAIAPYTRFVGTERDKVDKLGIELTQTAQDLRELRSTINHLQTATGDYEPT